MTSTYSGPVSGMWTIDGVDWEPISEIIAAETGLLHWGPELPTTSTGTHTLGARIDSPNSLTSGTITYQVLELAAGPSDHLIGFAFPPSVEADGISTSSLVFFIVDEDGTLVTDDNSTEVTFTLSGEGSVTSSAIAERGVASATYTAGTSEGEATITAIAWLAMGLDTKSVTITLAPSIQHLLARYDYCRDDLTDLRMDMFLSPLDRPLSSSYDCSDADIFVDTRIRYGVPTAQDLESFERLALAAQVARMGYRWAPVAGDGNPIGDPQPIGGAQELMHAGVKNTYGAVSSGISIAALLHGVIGQSGWSVVRTILKSIANWLLKLSTNTIDRIIEGILDKEVANSLSGLGTAIRVSLETIIAGPDFSMAGLLENPAVTGPVTADYLGDRIEKLQPDLNQAVSWANSNTSAGSIESARQDVAERISLIRTKSSSALSRIQSMEDSYTPDWVSMSDMFENLKDAVASGDLAVIRDAFMNTMGDMVGTNKFVFA